MKRNNEIPYEELLARALDTFVNGPDVYPMHNYIKSPYPVEYLPYTVLNSITRALNQAGFEPMESPDLDDKLEDDIKAAVTDWPEIEARRRKIGRYLNRYGGLYRPFNPN
jgi:hypothetical protein